MDRRASKIELSGYQASAMCIGDMKRFIRDFVQKNSAAFSELPREPPAGMEEQQHAWYEVFERFNTEAEVMLNLGAEKYALLQEPKFITDFIEKASSSGAIDEFLAAADYQRFIAMVRTELFNPSTADLGPAPPESVRAIDERLAVIELERANLLKQRRKLIGRSAAAGDTRQATSVKSQIDRQRYLDDVGMD
eukprot:TRINITY_DN13491_c0_g1_i1.p1 TRINITY_DN13491_c0_g1~~TRINITY_DN13491_c0_g1_i1.p1  ORF type:complete len:193 (+),score=47.83 TRINITY_DN13491_c0_g1_i1:99-677(+)